MASNGLVSSFNGAAFFQSGKSSSGNNPDCGCFPLQWSRFFSKRKIYGLPVRSPHGQGASMEPLFFKAENAEFVFVEHQPIRGFNGAAFFQSGKLVVSQRNRKLSVSLQWSRFFSKRKIAGASIKINATPSRLQWSRFFSKRKIL